LRSTIPLCTATAQVTASITLNPVAGGLDDAPAMLVDFGVDQFAPMRLHPREGAFFVRTHKPAVPRDVRGENGGQPSFDAFGGQSGAP
jgi:hypothetical protein